jgi:hypothetical protein
VNDSFMSVDEVNESFTTRQAHAEA